MSIISHEQDASRCTQSLSQEPYSIFDKRQKAWIVLIVSAIGSWVLYPTPKAAVSRTAARHSSFLPLVLG
ncbi:hypothetical protein N0V90_010750 [Kalmusia sp. IMI 367209]|nr:hypothetical protein N0V90_010750 [Kalmusia sp. IMI 367209]